MKKVLLMALAVFFGMAISSQAQNAVAKQGEKIFLKHADDCLLVIEKEAQSIGIKGVAIMAFIPGDSTTAWLSKMKVEGALTRDNLNFLAIANSKSSEMALTLKSSGSGVRPLLHGELGYPGGVIKKVNAGYILAAFSGGSSEQDFVAASKGLEELSKYF